LKTQMHKIREMMGICPQHDILFNELTAREHIELYAGLKGVPVGDWSAIVDERLGAVKLLNVADNPIASFSGGMKRRLSVVIATIGDPKIIFLDGTSS
jgi:ABC-type multidrug transport system ATPase subunit